MNAMHEIIIPRLEVVTHKEVAPATLEAFEIGRILTEDARSHMIGRNDCRRFYHEVPAHQLELESMGMYVKKSKYGFVLDEVKFQVYDKTDDSSMSLSVWRRHAQSTDITDSFSQTILGYFRDHLSS